MNENHEENESMHTHDHEHDRDNEELECGCGHDHEHNEKEMKLTAARLAAAVALIIINALLPEGGGWSLAVCLAAYLIIGGDIVWRAVVNLLHGRVFDENFLMSVASAGAFAIGEYGEAVMVMLLYQLGELLHTRAAARSRRSIEQLSENGAKTGDVQMYILPGTRTAQSESFIRRFARVYTPVVTGLAVLVAVLPPLFGFGSWHDWLYRGLTVLVTSCPCALVISIPLGFFAGMGGASKEGILIKGGGAIEALAKGAEPQLTEDHDAAELMLAGGSLGRAKAISARTMRIVRQNVVFILLVKAAALSLGAAGISPMWLAVFADAGVTLLAVLNSMRAITRAK